MKKKYKRPDVIRVRLNHEQAILGQCFNGGTLSTGDVDRWCNIVQNCKQYSDKQSGNSDSAASS